MKLAFFIIVQLRIIVCLASNFYHIILLEHCRHFPQNQARERVLALLGEFHASLSG
ncbi:hypothetical protein [Halomonas dongshanensis]|uniref:Uncharacterized protein n=1 Tax=Halomonas dongshanensis TaxID=2890835 RepID=A0ABT2EAY3_9GAMM|nr:hypothetical protein [Halomonas dongshanensis]MCS2607792.1 hypothetical protein [Halomonas dongshanensis]